MTIEATHPDTEDKSKPSVPNIPKKRIPPHKRRKATQSATQPSIKHAFWFVVFVLNAAFLIFLIPTSILGNEKLSLLLKAVSWLGGSVLVLGFKWFRDHILKLTERLVFKTIQCILLIVLSVILILGLPLFKLYLFIEPADAEVQIDEAKMQSAAAGCVRLSLQPHEITVTDKKTDDNGQPIQRKFNFAFSDIFQAWRNPKRGLHMPLLYDVPIEVENAVTDLTIRKDDLRFDSEFWNNPPKSNLGKDLRRGVETGTLLVSWNGHADSLRLPYGDYHIVARQENCRDADDRTVHVNCDVEIVKFSRALRCPR